MTPDSPSQTAIGSWFRRRRQLLALLRDDDYRRDALSLLLTNLRGIAGWRLVGGVILLGAVAGYLLARYGESARLGYEVLQSVLGVATLGLGAMLYADERENGTFELLWLATGSERAILRLRMTTLMVLVALLALPAIPLASLVLPEPIPFAPAAIHLLTNSFFLLSAMALIGAWIPQSWAAGLVGLALFSAVQATMIGSATMLNPLLNPIDLRPDQAGIAISNRIILVVLGMILLRAAAARLRRTL